jgi:hypothetical protein
VACLRKDFGGVDLTVETQLAGFAGTRDTVRFGPAARP